MVCVALADAVDGPTCRHEHRSVRRFLFRSLHPGLREAPAGNESAERVNGKDRPRPNQGTRNESAIQHQRHSRRHLRRRSEHSGRRSFYRTGEELRGRTRHFQRADDLSKHRFRRDSPGFSKRQNR